MIEKNTVILTGAGANKDYGFPTGTDFQREIPQQYIQWFKQHISPLGKDWAYLDKTEQMIDLRKQHRFVDAYRDADIPIDQYISQQNLDPGFATIAKHAIILGLIDYESRTTVTGEWLEELLRQLTTDLHDSEGYKKVSDNKVKFITFNYDRVIENFLYKRLKNIYGIDDAKVKNVVRNIDVTHVFGKIANLEWEDDPILPYGGLNVQPIGNRSFELTENIDLVRIDHDVSELKSFQQIRAALEKAERLYILGFGYYDYNIKVLGFPDSIKNVEEIYSTRIGLLGRRNQRVLDNCFKYQKTSNVYLENSSCQNLLQKYDLE